MPGAPTGKRKGMIREKLNLPRPDAIGIRYGIGLPVQFHSQSGRGSMLLAFFLLTLSPNNQDYEKWLNEDVPYLLSVRERKEFETLETDAERDRFIEGFWRIRDLDPSTAVNEVKEEHYRRIDYANNRYKFEGKPGWKTERGRVYIIHGPPDTISYGFGGQHKVIIRNPTDLINKTRTAQPIIDFAFPAPESETWVYRSLPSATTYRGYFTIIFSKMDPTPLYSLQRVIASVGNSLEIDQRYRRDRAIVDFTTRNAHFRNEFKIIYAGEPQFSDFSDMINAVFEPSRTTRISQFDIQEAIGDAHRPSGELLEIRHARRLRMEEMVEGRVFYDLLPIEVGYAFLRSYSGHVNIPMTAQVSLGKEDNPEYLDVFAEIIDPESNQAVALFQDRIRPRKRRAALSEDVAYQTRLGAAPGRYRFRVVVSDIENKKVGLWDNMIVVPELTTTDFSASDLVICDDVLTHDTFKDQLATRTSRDWITFSRQNPLRLDEWIFVPSADKSFRRRETLTTVVEVYNPTLDAERPTVEVQAACRRDGSTIAVTDVKELDYLTGEDKDIIVYAFSVPLKSFDPGSYDFVVRIVDKPTGRVIEKQAPFRIF